MEKILCTRENTLVQQCYELEKPPSKSKKNDGEKPYAALRRLMVEGWETLCNKICPIILDIYIVNKKTLFTLNIPPIYWFRIF